MNKNLLLKKKSYKAVLLNGIEKIKDNNKNIICYSFQSHKIKSNETFYNKKLALQSIVLNQKNLMNQVKLPLRKQRFDTYSEFNKYFLDSRKNSSVLALLVYKNKIFLGEGALENFELSEEKLFLTQFFLLRSFLSFLQLKIVVELKDSK
jgi:hypothetical protein